MMTVICGSPMQMQCGTQLARSMRQMARTRKFSLRFAYMCEVCVESQIERGDGHRPTEIMILISSPFTVLLHARCLS